jgi:hypothetical protein
LTHIEMLRRRGEILKRNMGTMILKDNRQGLSGQESYFYQNMLKEFHRNEYELNTIKKNT